MISVVIVLLTNYKFVFFLILGLLYDATQSFDYSFYFAGTLITLSAILCYPLNWVNKWEKARAELEIKKPAV